MKNKSSFFLVILVLLSFLGQATAYAMDTCQLPMSVQSTSADNMMSHHGNMADMNIQTEHDCCDTEHLCTMNGCVSVGLIHFLVDFDTSAVSQKIISQFSLVVNYLPASLYRPPIIS